MKEIQRQGNRKEDLKTPRHEKNPKEKALGIYGLCTKGLKIDIESRIISDSIVWSRLGRQSSSLLQCLCTNRGRKSEC